MAPELTGRVADGFSAHIRALEEESLSPYAVRSYETRGRAIAEEECRLRTPFQRDRDRIVHSKSFRRLKDKTQVFMAPRGDHFRTRLTHTLEAAGISRVVARALRLNEDLTEAIAIGHDLGHPPFGHTGEEALDAVLFEHSGRHFRHNEHSLRIVEILERDGRGLNLTVEVRDGILNHTGRDEPSTLEGKIVRIVDRVAYINHDIDDALRAGILSPGDLPREEIELLGSDRFEADRHAGSRSRRDFGRARGHPPEPGDRARHARLALVHVRARLPGPGRRERASPRDGNRSAHLRGSRRAP